MLKSVPSTESITAIVADRPVTQRIVDARPTALPGEDRAIVAAFNRYIKEPVGKDANKADPEFTH